MFFRFLSYSRFLKMSDSIVFFSFAEEAVDHALWNCEVCCKLFQNLSFKLTFETRLYRHRFLFVVSSMFRLTQQFEVVCFTVIEKTWTYSPRSKKNVNVMPCQFFEWTVLRGWSRASDLMKARRDSKDIAFQLDWWFFKKSVNVTKEMENVQRVTIKLWIHLGGLLSI